MTVRLRSGEPARVLITILLCLVGAGAFSQRSVVAQERRVTVSGPALCPACRIERIHIASVGDTTGPAILASQASIMGGHAAAFYVFTPASPGVLLAFARNGSFLRAYGRPGRGPGEFMRPAHTIPRQNGRIQIVDVVLRRWTMVDSSMNELDVGNLQFYFDKYVQLRDGTLVGNGILQTRAAIGYPLHILDDSLHAVRSFGTERPVYDPRRPYLLDRMLAAGDANTFWAVPMNRLEVQKWNTAGELIATFTRSADAFQPWEDIGTLMQLAPPKNEVGWIHQDVSGLMWVVVHLADANWTYAGDPGHVPAVDSDNNRFYDTRVEVWDLEAGRLLASERFDEYLFGFRNGQPYLYTAREDAIGNPFYDIWVLRLTGR